MSLSTPGVVAWCYRQHVPGVVAWLLHVYISTASRCHELQQLVSSLLVLLLVGLEANALAMLKTQSLMPSKI
jgi:hypothetical protein